MNSISTEEEEDKHIVLSNVISSDIPGIDYQCSYLLYTPEERRCPKEGVCIFSPEDLPERQMIACKEHLEQLQWGCSKEQLTPVLNIRSTTDIQNLKPDSMEVKSTKLKLKSLIDDSSTIQGLEVLLIRIHS